MFHIVSSFRISSFIDSDLYYNYYLRTFMGGLEMGRGGKDCDSGGWTFRLVREDT